MNLAHEPEDEEGSTRQQVVAVTSDHVQPLHEALGDASLMI